VGAGAIGIRGALSHLSLPDVQDRARLAAVCDPVPGRAQAAAEKFGVPSAYEDYESLLADPDVDAVTIGSPIGIHYEQGVAAIETGKHIHFNKTMAMTADECDDLIARAEKKGVRLVASPGMMLWPYNQRIRDRIREGAIGQVIWAVAGAAVSDYHLTEEFRTGDDILTDVDPTWYFRKPAGGPLWDVTVYCLHGLTGILGSAKRVTALSGLALKQREYRGRTIECDMDDSTFMLLDFGSSAFATVYGTVSGDVAVGFHPSIFGTDGSVVGTEARRGSARGDVGVPCLRGHDAARGLGAGWDALDRDGGACSARDRDHRGRLSIGRDRRDAGAPDRDARVDRTGRSIATGEGGVGCR
jgi:predicted dehydrogenase